MWSWQMRSSSSVVTPGLTWGVTMSSTSLARRPAMRQILNLSTNNPATGNYLDTVTATITY